MRAISLTLLLATFLAATTQIRVETRVVPIDVTITRSTGKPVRDLTRNDFTILDEGKPRRYACSPPNPLRRPRLAGTARGCPPTHSPMLTAPTAPRHVIAASLCSMASTAGSITPFWRAPGSLAY
jgi:hypothetical protein